jgi:hypothetical protein
MLLFFIFELELELELELYDFFFDCVRRVDFLKLKMEITNSFIVKMNGQKDA